MGTTFIEDELIKRSSVGFITPMRDGDTIVAGSGTAFDITFDPFGDVASTNVQSAIEELDTEKVKRITSVDNEIARFDGTGGDIQGYTSDAPTISDDGNIIIANDKWLSADNYAGSDVINQLKVNEDDEINIGGSLITGGMVAEVDSGAIVAMDMPVSATPAAGTEESYSYRVDGDTIMKVYAEADSAGGIQNPGVVVEYQINLKEMTTPTAITNYGAVYTKSDNNLYFQDGAGVEHQLAFV